jgi:crotonobetainyl-CoA:carnitine CoA-transferase CaiB-like acyl-CoA transferase
MQTDLFADLVVVDCASFIAGPAAATIMADFGAKVIKIEPPGTGDSLRQVVRLPGLPVCDDDYFWLLDNRSKQGLALDLKHEEGRRVLLKLVAEADVFVTNYPAPIRQRLGLRAEDLTPLNERLIYASLTPYGELGPERDSTGYDATAWWARSGLMDAVRSGPDTPPAISAPGMGDHPTAVALFGAIMAALYRRERTGRGGHVSTSLLANGLWSFGGPMQANLCGAAFAALPGRGHRGALTEFYRCRDGRWFLLAMLNQAREWPLLMDALGQPDWAADARFATPLARAANNAELVARLEATFVLRDWADWKRILGGAGVTFGEAARAQDHLTCPQIAANEMIRPVADVAGLKTIDSPIHIEGETKRPPRRAPAIGEHSREVLAFFGFEASEIDALIEAGAVAVG